MADRYNHRITEWQNDATSGHVMISENGNIQLNQPVNFIVDKENDSRIIFDNENKRRVR